MKQNQNRSNRPGKKWVWILLVLLVLIFLFRRCTLDLPEEMPAPQPASPSSVPTELFSEPLSSSSEEPSSSSSDETPRSSPAPEPRPHSSSDTAPKSIVAPEPTAADTLPPELLFDPPEGRYFGKVEVSAGCDEPRCTAQTALETTPGAAPASGGAWETSPRTLLPPGGVVWAVAEDSAGNRTALERREYTVVPGSPQCGAHAVPVETASGGFCIDQYEWPNLPGAVPLGGISHAAAADSCASQNKRLCSLAEWKTACEGPKKTEYPYGERYRQKSCFTAEKSIGRSGRKSGCRSWFGAYDLSGNLWEWTSTAHPGRTDRYEVAGGSWGAGDRSSCRDTKWSFFPQNEYPIIGFRCCASLGEGSAR